MGELRKDYILSRYSLISANRGKRPNDFAREKISPAQKTCYFCPGNESMTPAEIERTEENGRWKIRVFPNKFPAVTEESLAELRTDNRFFTFAPAYGKHEVLVETPSHDVQMADLSEGEIAEVLRMYAKRIRALSSVKGVKYGLVFKNEGNDAGASFAHAHTQIVAYNQVPPLIADEMQANSRDNGCEFCRIIDIEKKSFRAVSENEHFAAFAPYAPRMPFEIWLFAKRHVASITGLGNDEIKSLAAMLKKVLLKLKTINAPYNFYLHSAPEGKDFHFHIEILPRLAIWAGFELATGAIICTMPPEDAAKFYRGE